MRIPVAAILGAVIACAGAAGAAEVRVAVAANFAVPMERVGAAFSAATGHTIKLTPGATGRFYSQIIAGAPFDVLIAADDDTPARLVAEGQAVAGSNFTYATGRLVLWSAQPGLVDGQGAVLGSTRFAHLAIANPKLAPYGRAAMEVLRSRGLGESLAPRLVMGESIAQAYQFVVTGNAELGFVALSQVAVPGKPASGSSWLVPPSLHSPIRQDAVRLKAGEGNPAATALLDYLKSDAARSVIQSYGYGF
ncbi:MAG TPA: molybdate ABC transporter substrate-binding protein [Rubrivivax sp.]